MKIIILGPTGSGKTNLSIYLSKITGFPIINFDSCQFYKNCKILSCSPTIEEQKQANHFLFNFLENNEKFSIFKLQKYVEEFSNCILVGGNFFYAYCLIKGVPDIKISKETKNKVLNISNKFDFLNKLDHKHNIHFNDNYRINRALEVFLEYKKPIRSFYSTKKNDFFLINIQKSKNLLERIQSFFQEAVDECIKNGFIKEFTKIIGYTDIWNYIEKKATKEVAINEIFKKTKKYSKNQKKWFKKFDFNINI